MPNYALVMKIHFWDAFAQRQLERLKESCSNADIFVLVDETNGYVPGIHHDKIVRFTLDRLISHGLAREAPEGSVIWWNGDYPMYAFLEQQPTYERFLFVEFDVFATMNFDNLIGSVSRDGVDHVSYLSPEPIREWFWADMHRAVYDLAVMRRVLFCVCYITRPALCHLLARRRAMATAFAAGTLPMWPFCEAFIGTELASAGFRLRDLSDYGDISRYEWWPPYRETDLAAVPPAAFVHPVLDETRFVQSVLRYSPFSFFRPGSLVNRKLRAMPPQRYLPALAVKILAKLQSRVSTLFYTRRSQA